MAVNCGYTEQQIDELTFPFYLDLCRYWEKICPPLNVMLAAKIGWKPKAEEPKGDLSELAQMFGGAS